MSKTNSKPSANGIKFLTKIAKQNGVLCGGSYDDARVSKALRRAGLIVVEWSASGGAFHMLTDAGRAALAAAK